MFMTPLLLFTPGVCDVVQGTLLFEKRERDVLRRYTYRDAKRSLPGIGYPDLLQRPTQVLGKL